MLVFTYGTLMQNYGNHDLLAAFNPVFLGEYKIDNVQAFDYVHYLRGVGYNSAFPVLFANGKKTVSGELYEVPADTEAKALALLDHLEGNGMMYKREVRTVYNDAGDTAEAIVYLGVNKYWDDSRVTLIPFTKRWEKWTYEWIHKEDE